MWKRRLGAQVFTFHLAGINNQNFLMRDEETGSFWQQISGKAISGPMAGRQLEPIHSEELAFGTWRKENPRGAVLLPVKEFEKEYEPKNWETSMLKARTVVDTSKTGIPARRLMIGISLNGVSRAYPIQRVLDQKLVQDRIGATAVLLVVGSDGKSIRAFQRPNDTDFYRKEDGSMIDSESGTEWTFQGCTVQDHRCLTPVDIIRDYWFDWHLYHPDTTVYSQ